MSSTSKPAADAVRCTHLFTHTENRTNGESTLTCNSCGAVLADLYSNAPPVPLPEPAPASTLTREERFGRATPCKKCREPLASHVVTLTKDDMVTLEPNWCGGILPMLDEIARLRAALAEKERECAGCGLPPGGLTRASHASDAECIAALREALHKAHRENAILDGRLLAYQDDFPSEKARADAATARVEKLEKALREARAIIEWHDVAAWPRGITYMKSQFLERLAAALEAPAHEQREKDV